MELTMTRRVSVYAYAADPIVRAGTTSQLAQRQELEVRTDDADTADVAVIVADTLDEETRQVMRAMQRNGRPRIVVVLATLDDASLVAAVEAGACGLLRRSEATPLRLLETVLAASRGDGSVPSDLLGRLLDQVGRVQRNLLAPRGLSFRGLTDREIDVVRLLSEGFDTCEIATKLSYSERTVKSVIHDMTTRLALRNRAHAVAYAMREGFI
jgi:DNA-binding NarL/FixJ family response regulator